MNKSEKLWTLFKTTFLISMTANSGYAILSVMKNSFVSKEKWFSEEEMTDYIALAQSTPGPIAVNISMVIGYQIAGLWGSFAAVSGCILPPMLVMILVTFFYNRIIQNIYVAYFMKGMAYGVVAMLLDVLIGLFINVTKKEKIYPLILIVLSFIYIRVIQGSVFYLALGCVMTALAKTFLLGKKVKEKC